MPDPASELETETPIGWELWRKHMAWKDTLHKKASHAALGLPEDDMIVSDNRTTNTSGLDWKLAAVLAAAGLGGAAMYQFMDAPEPVAPSGPVDSEYEVRFFDAEGKPVSVQPLPERLREN